MIRYFITHLTLILSCGTLSGGESLTRSYSRGVSMTELTVQDQTNNRTTQLVVQLIAVLIDTQKSREKTFFEMTGNLRLDRCATDENLGASLPLFDTSIHKSHSRVQPRNVASVADMARHTTGCSLRSTAFLEPQTSKALQTSGDSTPVNVPPATPPTLLTPAPSQLQSATACHPMSAGGIASNQTACLPRSAGRVASYDSRLFPSSNRLSPQITRMSIPISRHST